MNAIQIQRGASAGTATKVWRCTKSAERIIRNIHRTLFTVAGEDFTVGQLVAANICWPCVLLCAGWCLSGHLVAGIVAGAVAAVCILWLSEHETEKGGAL